MTVYSKTKEFKGIKKNPTLLGFGCMRFPLIEGTNEIDEELTIKMVDYAYQSGITYYDTAYPYHEGKSELMIGKALKKYQRDSFYLANKMPTWLINSKEDVKRIFEEQLKKCQVEYFDYYLCHALNKDNFEKYKLPGVMDFLYQMKEKGKIKHLGFSFHDTPEVLKEIIATYRFDFVQIQLNYLDWTYQRANEQYEIIEKTGLPILVMEPIRGGTLADLGDDCNQIFKEVNKKASIASWALRYAASKPQVMCVLSGMSNFEQVQDNVKTMIDFKELSHFEESVIQTALDKFLKSRTVPCTGCRYCMDCPMGVEIPLNFKLYNNYRITKREEGYINSYKKLEAQTASSCVNCKKCVSKCPQHIDIPQRLKEIAEFVDTVREKY